MTSTKKELLSGVFYTAIAKYSGIIVSLVVAGILARLIDPEDFGVVAIATVIISFFNIFSDLGIAPAIIQNKTLLKKDFSNIFTFTLWLGISIAILFFLCSWPISHFYKNNTLLTICQLLSLNLFFASANIVPNALLYKKKEFKFIAYRSLTIQIIGGSMAIIAALMGAGLYALVINPILSSILLFIISFRKNPQKLSRTWGIQSMKKIFSFSAYQFMFNVINYFSRNLDKLLIGKYMDMVALGYYEKSYRLMMLPLQNITHVISPVMHPIFSDFQNDLTKLSISYNKVIRFLAFIGFPLSVLLCSCSKEIILIIFGEQWMPSVPVFQILSISVGIQIILSTSGSIFQAANDTRSLFICGLFSTLLNIIGILTGIFFFKTLEAVAWCICITFTINFVQCYIWMYKITFKEDLWKFWKQFLSPTLLTGILIVCLLPIYYISDKSSIYASLLLKGSVFTIIYVAYVQIRGEYNIINFIKSKIKK
ncbi:lipopolysaccharide biosynthesis protein [Parabacteroides segnis]|uniref:lipopolysaccharide biosynthesis protein n=1 Tax=Parabacteroides segnis TaxID=2763058 RepID=UPI003514C2AB